MARKFLLQDIAESLSAREGITKRKAELFLRAFFELTEEGVLRDSFVKVTNFGTTKIVDVSPRESVNVNTGERIQINGHAKVSFLPDSLLRNLVNRPFELFSTALLHENTTEEELDAVDDTLLLEEVEEERMQEEKEEELLPLSEDSPPSADTFSGTAEKPPAIDADGEAVDATFSTSDTDCKVSEERTTEEQFGTLQPDPQPDITLSKEETSDTLEDEEHYKKTAEIDIETETQTIVTTVSPGTTTSPTPASASGVTNIKGSIIVKTEKTEKDATTKMVNKWQIACLVLFTLLMTAIGYIIGFQLGQNTISPSSQHSSKAVQEVVEKPSRQPTASQAPQSSIHPEPSANKVDVQQQKTTSTDLQVAPVEQTKTPQKPAPAISQSPTREQLDKAAQYQQMPKGNYLIVGTLSTHVLKPGDNLYHLAKQIYGDKAFTRYVILYNGLQNPDLIAVGQTIKFPKLVEKSSRPQ